MLQLENICQDHLRILVWRNGASDNLFFQMSHFTKDVETFASEETSPGRKHFETEGERECDLSTKEKI